MTEWKPIETAPKDVLVLVATRYSVSIAEYDAELNRWYAYADDELAYDGNDETVKISGPLFWTPLPQPPKDIK